MESNIKRGLIKFIGVVRTAKGYIRGFVRYDWDERER